MLDQQNMKLLEIKAEVYDIESVGQNVNREMKKNTETIERALNKAKGANEDMSEAEKLIAEMNRRMFWNRCIIKGVIGAIILGFVIIIVYKIYKITK